MELAMRDETMDRDQRERKPQPNRTHQDMVSDLVAALCRNAANKYGVWPDDVTDTKVSYHEVSAARRLVCWVLSQSYGMTHKEISDHTGIRVCTVGTMIGAVKRNGGIVPDPGEAAVRQSGGPRKEKDSEIMRLARELQRTTRHLSSIIENTDAPEHKRIEARRRLQAMSSGHFSGGSSSSMPDYGRNMRHG